MNDVMNKLDDLMANEYDALTWMEKPIPESFDKAIETFRDRITDKEYSEIEENMMSSYNYVEKYAFEQGFMRGIAVAKGGVI